MKPRPQALPLEIERVGLRFEEQPLESFVERADRLPLGQVFVALQADEVGFGGRRARQVLPAPGGPSINSGLRSLAASQTVRARTASAA